MKLGKCGGKGKKEIFDVLSLRSMNSGKSNARRDQSLRHHVSADDSIAFFSYQSILGLESFRATD